MHGGQMVVSGRRWLLPVWDSIQVSPRHDRPFSHQHRHPPRLSQPTSYSTAIIILYPHQICHAAAGPYLPTAFEAWTTFCSEIGSWFVQLLLATKYRHKSHLGSNIWWSEALLVKYLVIKSLAITCLTLGEGVCVCCLTTWERNARGRGLILESPHSFA